MVSNGITTGHKYGMDKQLLDQDIPILILNLHLQWTPMVFTKKHRKYLTHLESSTAMDLIRLLSSSFSISHCNGLQW